MKLRMALATCSLLLGTLALSACTGQSVEPANSAPAATSGSTSAAATPTTAATISTAADLVGDWHDVEAEWVVHFKDDGTFVTDFQGLENFLVGTYTVDGTKVSLIGDDGNTDVGTIEGQSLKFRLGTLTRTQ